MPLTVAELKKTLEQLPDDALIMCPAFPKSARPLTRAVIQHAEYTIQAAPAAGGCPALDAVVRGPVLIVS